MADTQTDLTKYIDLTGDAVLDGFLINPHGFDCEISGPDGKIYRGFLLAKSPSGQALTLCDVNFQWSETDKKFAPRLTFRRTNQHLEDKPINKGQRFQRIPFEDGIDGYRQFWQMIGFLAKFKETVDLGKHFYGLKVVSKDSIIQSLKEKEVDERKQAIVDYATESGLTLEDMAGAMTYKLRSDDLVAFKKLIDDAAGYRAKYRIRYGPEIKGHGTEAVFHHFLRNHKWIFGLSLDLKFIDDFVDEASLGVSDTTNSGNPQVDMLGWNDFTVLVELKTPDANFFTATRSTTARANTWSFANEFIDGYSQVLAQKESWTVDHKTKDLVHNNLDAKEVINQSLIRTIDPKAIFVYGNKERELPANSQVKDIHIKRDTLERFLRDHKNVIVISYDELYRRAYYIVHTQKAHN